MQAPLWQTTQACDSGDDGEAYDDHHADGDDEDEQDDNGDDLYTILYPIQHYTILYYTIFPKPYRESTVRQLQDTALAQPKRRLCRRFRTASAKLHYI